MYTVKNKQTRLHYFSSLQIWSLQGLEFLLLWGLVSHTQASFFICVCVSRRVTFRQTGEDRRAEQYQSVCLCFCHMFFCGECVDVFDANVRYGCLCLCDPAGRTISPPLFPVNSYASVVTPTVGRGRLVFSVQWFYSVQMLQQKPLLWCNVSSTGHTRSYWMGKIGFEQLIILLIKALTPMDQTVFTEQLHKSHCKSEHSVWTFLGN